MNTGAFVVCEAHYSFIHSHSHFLPLLSFHRMEQLVDGGSEHETQLATFALDA